MIGAADLKPISWRVWAGKVERESGGGGPFQGLEDRMGFVDIRVGFLQTIAPKIWEERSTGSLLKSAS